MIRLGTRGPRSRPNRRVGRTASLARRPGRRIASLGRIIATRVTAYASQTYVSGTDEGDTYRAPYTCRQSGRGLILCYGNWSLGGEAAPTTSIYVKASIELADGSLVPVYLNGEREVEIRPAKMVAFDPVDVGLSYGDIFYVRTYVRTASDGDNVPQAFAGSYTGMWKAAGGDYTTSAPGSTTNLFTGNYGPICVRAAQYDASVPCPAILSDSLGAGQGDSSAGYSMLDTNNVGPGHYKRAFDGATFPLGQFSVNGARLDDYTANGFAEQRIAQLAGCTGAIVSLGSNDLAGAGGYTHEDIIDGFEQLIARITGEFPIPIQRVGVSTIWPRVTGTFTTLEGQTVPSWSSNYRVPLNAAIRNREFEFGVLIDPAVTVESPTAVGKWDIDVQLTTDGSHGNSAAYVRAAAAVNVNPETWG